MRSRKTAGGGFIAGTGAQSPRGWVRVTPAAAFSPRDTAEGGVIFKKKMWLSNGFYHGSVLHRDLWSSSDGATWVRVLDNTPYDGYSELAVYRDKLWAVKGTVWNSDDGVDWKPVSPRTPFGVRGYGELVVFRDRLWQLGSGKDVWHTADGVTWAVRPQSQSGGSAMPWRHGFRPRTSHGGHRQRCQFGRSGLVRT